jgi:hypothetical protein
MLQVNVTLAAKFPMSLPIRFLAFAPRPLDHPGGPILEPMRRVSPVSALLDLT